MASSSGTLYIGFTNDLLRRVSEHKEGKIKGFTKKYTCDKFIYYEQYNDVYVAMNREKEIKKWRREKKQDLIEKLNPHWNDLYKELAG